MDMSVLGGSGMEIVIQGRDLDTLLAISQDMMDLLGQVEGFIEISNGQEDGAPQIRVTVDKDKAMQYGLTVAQIYSDLSAALTTETTSTTLTVGQDDYDVVIVDERDALTRENLLDYPFTVQVQGENGETEEEAHTLGEFATVQTDASLSSISRDNQQRYMTVTAATEEGYNTTLLSRQVEQLLADYQVPEGYTIQISGEVETLSLIHIYYAPGVTAEAIKTSIYASCLLDLLGKNPLPRYTDPRNDIITSFETGDPEAMVAFCQGIQAGSPVDSFAAPEPYAMPGYTSEVIMAAGAFTNGSSIELSCDGPMRPPYTVYLLSLIHI